MILNTAIDLPRRRCSGFGMIEMMVSVVVSLILLAAVSTIYMSGKQTFNTSNNVARMQENSRFALGFINQDLRMAGFSGCVRTIGNVLNTGSSAYDANFYDPNRVVGGWEFAGTAPGDAFSINSLDPASVSAGSWAGMGGGSALAADFAGRNLVPGSDVLIVKRADSRLAVNPALAPTTVGIPLAAQTFNINDGREQAASGSARTPAIEQFDLLVISNCQQADLFQNTADTDANPDLNPKPVARVAGAGVPGNVAAASAPFGEANPMPGPAPPYDSGAEIFAFTSNAYYIGTGLNGGPSLFRLSFSNGQPGSNDQQELVEGVENLQVLYGEDTDSDGIANKYVAADDVVDPANIVAVRIGLLMRASTHNEDFIDESVKQFFVADNTEIKPVADPNHLRYIANSTVQLRNMGLE